MATGQSSSKRKKAIFAEVRFEFNIPDGVPHDKINMYAWEKLKRLCRGLSKNGMKAIPVVPDEFID